MVNRITMDDSRMSGREIRAFLWITAGFMVLGFILGYALPNVFQSMLAPDVRHLFEVARATKAGDSWVYAFWQIFTNNLKVAILLALLGFIFGVFPMYSIIMNGLLGGFVIYIAASHEHIAAWKSVLFGVAPHGVFELTAIVWAAALGMANGYAVIIQIKLKFTAFAHRKRGKDPISLTRGDKPISRALRTNLRSFPYIIGLLFIAAIIESTATPALLQWAIHH